ncbi:WhiB family transcriptional regulator [Nocardia higoensis]|uniref:WhiB family transcriptional regulator n=1 Tax=Nocardia higoensis TaxID=228599 RepID=A0ABS0DII2_9NOCA|nr:WhiB family transcriptional regulator [Nocardia higoensis]MBF6358268.1 WhiB family transcriptional regulator [Nocardia higoensis]
MSRFLDPASRPERSCAGIPQDAFFVSGLRQSQVRAAQAVCAGCPVLAECAAWAESLVRARLLTDCVVAGVLVPTVDGSKARRHAAADKLAEIAAGGPIRVWGAA